MADISTMEKSQKRPFVGNVPQMKYKVRKVSAIKTFPRGSQQILLKKSNISQEIANVGVLGCDSTSETMLESKNKADPPLADPDSTKGVESLSELNVPNVAIEDPAPDSDANTGRPPLSKTLEVDLNLVDMPHSGKALTTETTNLLKLDQTEAPEMIDGTSKAFAGGCEQIGTSTSNNSAVKAEPLESREVNLSENLNGSKLFDSMKESEEPASKDSLNVVSKTEEKQISTSFRVQSPVESVKEKMYQKNVPQMRCKVRKVSAIKTFPRDSQQIVLKKSKTDSQGIPNVGVLGSDHSSESMLESQKKVDPPLADPDSAKQLENLPELNIVADVAVGDPAPDSAANTGISPLSSTVEVDMNLVESPHSWKALTSETTNLLKLDQTEAPEMIDDTSKPFAGGCEQIVTSTSNNSEVQAEPLEPREVNLSENLNGSKLFDSMKESDEPASKDSFNVVSKTEEKEVSTSFGVQLLVESVEEKAYQKYPRRSISAKRDFPVGCGRKALIGMEECRKSIQYSKDRRLGDEKSSGNDSLELRDRAKARQGSQEVQKADVFMGESQGKFMQGTGDRTCVYVRKKLKQMDTEETRFNPPLKNSVPLSDLKTLPSSTKVDKGIEFSGKKMGRENKNLSNTSLVRKISGKIVDELHAIDRSRVENHSMSEPCKGKEIVRAPTDTSNFALKQGKQTHQPPVGLTQAIRKSISKERELVVRKPFKSISSRRDSEDAGEGEHVGHTPGYDKKADSPLLRGSQHINLSTNPSGPHAVDNTNVDIQAAVARKKVKETLSLFQTICRELSRDEELKANDATGLRRIDCAAAKILKKNNKLVNTQKQILGAVPGVEVGDEFHYRVELAIIGIHRPYQSGIDYMKRGGKIVATSIVASGGYDDYKKGSDVLVYSGQGGHPVRGSTEATDQKLVRGNLALKNSMDEKTPVRVIRGFEEAKIHNSADAKMLRPASLTYDGLYLVERYWKEKGRFGTDVFMFQLRRM